MTGADAAAVLNAVGKRSRRRVPEEVVAVNGPLLHLGMRCLERHRDLIAGACRDLGLPDRSIRDVEAAIEHVLDGYRSDETCGGDR